MPVALSCSIQTQAPSFSYEQTRLVPLRPFFSFSPLPSLFPLSSLSFLLFSPSRLPSLDEVPTQQASRTRKHLRFTTGMSRDLCLQMPSVFFFVLLLTSVQPTLSTTRQCCRQFSLFGSLAFKRLFFFHHKHLNVQPHPRDADVLLGLGCLSPDSFLFTILSSGTPLYCILQDWPGPSSSIFPFILFLFHGLLPEQAGFHFPSLLSPKRPFTHSLTFCFHGLTFG